MTSYLGCVFVPILLVLLGALAQTLFFLFVSLFIVFFFCNNYHDHHHQDHDQGHVWTHLCVYVLLRDLILVLVHEFKCECVFALPCKHVLPVCAARTLVTAVPRTPRGRVPTITTA